ncbi:MAG: hybrid sensor histidine kinase/response regulator [Ketobacter sp.]|nr:MAG: hybrid sensor histidine kinase/response regulator [Ketobacter sp.]
MLKFRLFQPLLFVMLAVLCGQGFASPYIVPIKASEVQDMPLGKRLQILEDPSGTLLVEDVRSPDISRQFEPLFVDTPYLGRTHSVFWFRFDLDFSANDSDLILELGYPHLKHITLYRFENDQLVDQESAGYGDPNTTKLHCSRPCFDIPQSDGVQTLYLRVNSDSPLFVPINLRNPNSQLKSERIMMALSALFYGAFMVMGLFNLFLYFSTRKSSYIYYVAYIISVALWTLSHDGVLREMLFMQYEALASYRVHFIFTLLSLCMGAIFCQKFLNTAENMPLHHKAFSFLVLMGVVDIILIIMTSKVQLPNSANLLTILLCVAGLSAGSVGIMRGLKTARFFLIAWLSVIVGSASWVLTISGVFPLNKITLFSVHMGALLETILLGLALGDRINVLQAERIQVEKEAKRRLEENNIKLAASNRFKDEFLSTVSHELRTPMNGIFGAYELLEHTDLNTEQVKYLSTISRSSRDMMGMIENILTYTQLESGIAKPNAHPFRIKECLQEIAMHYRGRAAMQDLDFDFRLDNNIPMTLEGDEDKLRLLLDHLLDNAFKFTDQGFVRFEVTHLQSSEADQEKLMFVIRDSGCGVPESLQSDIFNSFKQADGSLTRRKGGLGIGLALCQRIISILQGKLEFKSVVNEGTQVVLTLPFRPAEDQFRQTNQISTTIKPENTDILVVEDNYVNKLVMEGQLRKLGFQVFSAGNGREAVSMMEKREYDLVFMDCQMPIMDGFEAARRIRQLNNRNASIPIIAVTANTNPGDREHCIAAGMNDYIKKPFNQAVLIAAINRWLSYDTEAQQLA